jgi:uncharacterized protein (DUF2267 family)
MDKQTFLDHARRAADLGGGEEAERRVIAIVLTLSHLLSDSARRRHFVSQLPGFLKSPLLEEARPTPLAWSRDGFVQHVASALDTHAPAAEAMLRGVYSVLREALSAGQIAEFEAQLPADVRAVLRPS